MNPYDPPQSIAPAKAPQATVRQMPIWVTRGFFAVAAVVLIADALTRHRPEIRPAWLELIAGPTQLLVALLLLLFAWTMQPTTIPPPNKVSN